MAEKIEELKKDLEELQNFESQATRHRVKNVLSLEIRKLSSEIIKLQDQLTTQSNISSSVSGAANKRYQIKLNNYAWDQTSKYVKFYITLQKVHTIPQENVECKFTSKSLELFVKDLENKDYVFTINNLLEGINPEQSSWKVKTDLVIVNAAKIKEDTWSHVTALEKKIDSAQSQKFKTDEGLDPNEGLMSMMKNMYEKGDDEMKRTIAKAWTESQKKTNIF